MKNIIILAAFFTSLLNFAQNNINPSNCTYSQSDLTLTLNGWDISRSNYDHFTFINTAALRQYAGLQYSGEKDTAEFGYPWFYYALDDNYIHFAGVLDTSGDYTGNKRLFSFKINSGNQFNLNGIEIGDATQEVFNLFPNHCIDGNEIVVFYDQTALSFKFNPTNNLITSMALDSGM